MKKITAYICLLLYTLTCPVPVQKTFQHRPEHKSLLAPTLSADVLDDEQLFNKRADEFGRVMEETDREYLWTMTHNNPNRHNTHYILDVLSAIMHSGKYSSQPSGNVLRAVRFLQSIPEIESLEMLRQAEELRKLFLFGKFSKSKASQIRREIAKIWETLCFGALCAAENKAAEDIFAFSHIPVPANAKTISPIAIRAFNAVRRVRNAKLTFTSPKSIPDLIRAYDFEYVGLFHPYQNFVTVEALVVYLRLNGYVLDPTDAETLFNTMQASANISRAWFLPRHNLTLADVYDINTQSNYPPQYYLDYCRSALRAGLPAAYTASKLLNASDAGELTRLDIESQDGFFYRSGLSGLKLKGRVRIIFNDRMEPEEFGKTFSDVLFDGNADAPRVLEDIDIHLSPLYSRPLLYYNFGHGNKTVRIRKTQDIDIIKALRESYGLDYAELKRLSSMCNFPISEIFELKNNGQIVFVKEKQDKNRLPPVFYLLAAAPRLQDKLFADKNTYGTVLRNLRRQNGEEYTKALIGKIAAQSMNIHLDDAIAMSSFLCRITEILPIRRMGGKNNRIRAEAAKALKHFRKTGTALTRLLPDAPEDWEDAFLPMSVNHEKSERLLHIRKILQRSKNMPLRNLMNMAQALLNLAHSRQLETAV